MGKAKKTGAERQASYVASGRAIACVIRDREAIQALERLESQHGGVTAAVTAALRAAAGEDFATSEISDCTIRNPR